MILLLSSSSDTNLDFVIDWLRFYRHPYLRINSDDPLHDDFHLSLTPPRLFVRQCAVDIDSIHSIWFRQFGNFRRSTYFHEAKHRVRSDALDQIAREHAVVINGLLALLGGKHWLTHPSRAHVNKIDMLYRAGQCGLTIPETHIINRKAELARLLETGEYICKSIYEPLFLKEDSGYWAMFTTRMETGDLACIDDTFVPSLVQKLIPKEYELRVFYLDGECYTMAIFSQQRQRTALDFRNVDWTDPPRNVPYRLPVDLEDSIRRFMTAIQLNCGSLDLIKSTDGRYYFLEVNPTGQFGMVAFPCNYPLYEKIALYLIQHDRP